MEMTLPALHKATVRFRAETDVRAAFDAQLSPLMVPLYRFAHGMTHNAPDAEDLVQEAVLHAYRAYGSFRHGTNFKAWLFRICVNVYIDGYRSRQHAPTLMPLMESDTSEDPAYPRTASPEEELLEHVVDEELEAALAALPESFRAVVLLTDMEGMAYEEAAAVLQIPVGTVRSRLFRARSQMRASLTDFARRHRLAGEQR